MGFGQGFVEELDGEDEDGGSEGEGVEGALKIAAGAILPEDYAGECEAAMPSGDGECAMPAE